MKKRITYDRRASLAVANGIDGNGNTTYSLSPMTPSSKGLKNMPPSKVEWPKPTELDSGQGSSTEVPHVSKPPVFESEPRGRMPAHGSRESKRHTWSTPEEMLDELIQRLICSAWPFNATVPGPSRHGDAGRHDVWMLQVNDGKNYSCIAFNPDGKGSLTKSVDVGRRRWTDVTYLLPEWALNPEFRGTFEHFIAFGPEEEEKYDFTNIDELNSSPGMFTQYNSGPVPDTA